jgi:ribonuclease P protein component
VRVAAAGQRVALPGLVLQALSRGDGGPARVGFTVTKRVGNAVTRNRIRRRLREAARATLAARPAAGMDLVLIGRQATAGRRFADLLADCGRALDRVGVRG